MRPEAIVLGVSAGGLNALKTLLPALPASFPPPLAIVQHVGSRSDDFLCDYLSRISRIAVKEAEDKQPLLPGTAILAPSGYHMLIEPDRSIALSVDPRVNHSCPSIDVLFESAAAAYGPTLIGVILTGANGDGAQGLRAVKACGGIAVVQNPKSAQAAAMPRAALAATAVDHIVELEQLAALLLRLTMGERVCA
jgi:two-component system chemotaxis response regulator CheB